MSPRSPYRLLAFAAPAVLIASAGAQAKPKEIGAAAVVVNDVRGETQGQRARIARGDRVFANQGVQTAAASMAKLVFLDDTNMTLGPDSRARLDSFVFDAGGAAKKASVSASKGAFRFVSGSSPSRAYSVTTPHAHIGVRGTTYDVRVQGGRTLVVLQEGAVNVCLRNRAQCRELTRPGESLVVTNNEIAGPISPASRPWDFGDVCAGRAADLCGVTRFAQLPPPRIRRAESSPEPRKRRIARPAVVEEDIIHVGPPASLAWEAGAVFTPHRGWRPWPGPGWRPHGALPPPNGGRRPVAPTGPRGSNPSRMGGGWSAGLLR